MGGQIGLLRDPNELLQKYLPDYAFSKTLNSVPFQHTFMCATPDEGQLVCKLILEDLGGGQPATNKQEDPTKEVRDAMNRIHERFDLLKHPNVLTLEFRKFEERSSGSSRSIYCTLRQYVYQSLRQKLQTRIPASQTPEKQWLALQALCAVSQIHQQRIVHGDIKPENVLVTSYNQLYLTDLVSYKPTYFKDDDLKHYNHYFGELDNNQKCYFAPERFREQSTWLSDDSLKNYNKLEGPMDIFSLGCVIAEIFMDGAVLFDLGKLQQYRKHSYNPKVDLEKKIPDPAVVDLIARMIDIEPSKRPLIDDAIKEWNTRVMPQSFSRVFFQLSSSFVRPQYLYSDLKISMLRKYMPSIWRTCFDSTMKPAEVSRKFREPIERVIFEKLRKLSLFHQSGSEEVKEDDILHYNTALIPSCSLFDFLSPTSGEPLDFEITEADKESILILIHWIGVFMGTCYYPQSRRCALEMLLVIGAASSLQIRLQYVLPYIFKMFDDRQSKVQAKAIEAAVLLFENLIDSKDELYLGGADFKVFDNYILPHFNKVQKTYKNDQLVQVTYTKYLPLLAKIGQRLTEISVTSRLAKRQQQSGQGSKNANFEHSQPRMEHMMNESERPSLVASQHEQKVKGDNQRQSREDEPASQVAQSEFSPQVQDVNFDCEIDVLRQHFLSVISDYAAADRQDTSIERLLFSRLGSLCDFFGSKTTMDRLIPLLHTCSNKKEFMIKLECLKSVTGVGIKVGKQTLSQYMLLIYIPQFLHDSEELVVLEIIKTLGRLLKMRLIPKSALMDDYQVKGDQASHHLFDKLLPFLLHPNTWIREETLNFVQILADHENTKLLSKAEVYCLIGRKIKPYLQAPELVHQVLFSKQDKTQLLDLLRTPLSRSTFEFKVKSDSKKAESTTAPKLTESKLSDSDEYAIKQGKLEEVIAQTQRQYQNDTQMRFDFKQLSKPSLQQRKVTKYNQYRVVKIPTLEELSKVKDALQNESAVDKRGPRKSATGPEDYYIDFFEPCNRVQEELLEEFNLGVNPLSPEVAKHSSQIEHVMQALNLLPDDFGTPLIEYENPQLFRKLANQSLPEEWRLQVEKLSSQVAQPSEMPTFHHLYSRTTSVEISSSNQQFVKSNNFCEQRTNVEKFRPQGRLVTTLFEHKNPVNCITVTDDQRMFFTSSRSDGMIHGWDTLDMLRDVTSHSRFTINSGRIVNSISALQGSNYFCLAGRDQSESTSGLVEIFEMSRLSQDSSAKVPGSVFKNVSAPNQRLPSHAAVVKTIDHQNEGEMMNCIDTMLPVSHQHLLAYSSQRGTLFLHDLRCKKSALVQQDTFNQTRGMLTCVTQGQDPYQLICGSIGGYVMVYDIRFDTVSSSFKHSLKYPITSIASFKPSVSANGMQVYNRSAAKSPMALVATGGPQYELSLLNLETGDLEIMMSVNEAPQSDAGSSDLHESGSDLPKPVKQIQTSFYRESLVRDCFNWPEKSETNQTLFRRYLMQTKSLVNTNQIKLTQNLDEELFKASKNRFKLVKQANESINACRKVLVPRKYTSLMQGTLTTEYAITGGNDMRLRYWDLNDPANLSYYINTPDNDECQYLAEPVAGGTQLVTEQVSRSKTFPSINGSLLQGSNTQKQPGKLVIPNTQIELKSDSVYYSVLQSLIQQGNVEGYDLSQSQSARKCLTQSSLGDISSGVAHQFQIHVGGEKIVVYNYNGLSEWQHMNGLSATEGNVTLHNSSYNDKWSQDKQLQTSRRQSIMTQTAGKATDQYLSQSYRSKLSQENKDLQYKSNDYLYRESQNVSHTDTVLDMAILDTDVKQLPGGSYFQQSNNRAQGHNSQGNESQDLLGGAVLITTSRDGTIKMWK